MHIEIAPTLPLGCAVAVMMSLRVLHIASAWTPPSSRVMGPSLHLLGTSTARTREIRSSALGFERPSPALICRYRGGSNYSPSSALYATVAPPPSPTASSTSGDNEQQVQELHALTRCSRPTKDFGGLAYQDTFQMQQFRVVFILGGPGAGKGSQCELMQQNYPTAHLSVGELLREEQARPDSPHAELLQKTLVAGRIVPVEISLDLLRRAMEKAAQEKGSDIIFLVDGFPRNFDNLSGWSRIMAIPDIASIWSVLVYQCPLSVLEERILKRAQDSGRADDNLTSLKKRFATFEQETMPVIEALRKASSSSEPCCWSVEDISGDQSIEDVWLATQNVLNRLVLQDVISCNAALLRAVETGNVKQYKLLCAPDWFDASDETKDSPRRVMEQQERDIGGSIGVTCARAQIIDGNRVAVSYNRAVQGVAYREKRIWSHQGSRGWTNIHYSRVPCDALADDASQDIVV